MNLHASSFSFRRGAIALALGLGLLPACGDDNAGATGDGGSSDSSTGADTGDTGMTNTTPSTVGDGTGDSGGSDSSSGGEESSSGGPTEVNLGGQIEDLALAAPIADAEIALYQMPGLTTTSDADGVWALGPFMPNQEIVFQIAPGDDYVGSIIPYLVGDSDDDNVRLAQISRMTLEVQEMGISGMMPAPVDPMAAIVVTRLISPTALSDGTVTVDMTPAPANDSFYAPDASGGPVLGSNVMEFSLLPVVVFFNLADTAPGEITYEFTHPTRECDTKLTMLPTVGEHVTLVDVVCMAP